MAVVLAAAGVGAVFQGICRSSMLLLLPACQTMRLLAPSGNKSETLQALSIVHCTSWDRQLLPRWGIAS